MPATPSPLEAAFRGQRVLVTGHTGFKGSWLIEWLLALGAEVTGFALPPETKPTLFDQLDLSHRIRHVLGDIRDAEAVSRVVAETQPDFVLHLAAQALVRRSYREPLATWQVNVDGTLHVLEALRSLEKPCAAVIVTTDKCYENREWVHGYREEDALGGADPYSSSKAAAEIATHAWRRSYFRNHPVRLASARAGNVIGGGDWAEDRIVPDCIRAWLAGEEVRIRNPAATRPWQHVLEPLSGYLWLAASLAHAKRTETTFEAAFNFGPGHDSNRTVGALVREASRHGGGPWVDASDPHAPHEAKLLQLSIDKAAAQLHWRPVWNFSEGVEETFRWYFEVAKNPASAFTREFTLRQIHRYEERARGLTVSWATPAAT